MGRTHRRNFSGSSVVASKGDMSNGGSGDRLRPLEDDPLEVVMASAQPKPDFEREWAVQGSNLRPWD
jgi:hypothetical protein